MSKKNDMLGAIVRAMVGVPLQFLGVMLDLCNKLAGKDGELWYEKMRLALRENVTQVGAQTLVVLGATTLAARITAGRYNWVHFLIDKKNFPHDPASVGEWEWKLVKFASGTSSEAIESAIIADGWQVGKLEHLLAFGKKYPDVQRDFPVVALGSSWVFVGERRVTCLSSDDLLRELVLIRWDVYWDDVYRFLAVRKKVQDS